MQPTFRLCFFSLTPNGFLSRDRATFYLQFDFSRLA